MLAQSVETSAASSTSTVQGQGDATVARAKSPLSQAMLQIHSPDSVPDLSVGDSVVLQMEEGKATLQMEEGKATFIANSNGMAVKSEKHSDDSMGGGKSASGSETDEVFDKKQDKMRAETNSKQSLQAVLSNLISTHAGNMNREYDLAKLKSEPFVPIAVSKAASTTRRSSSETSSPKTSPTILVSPTVSLGSNKGSHSPGSRKGSLSDITVPRPSNGSSPALSSPGLPQPQGTERKKAKSKTPHPAFNIQPAAVEKMGGVLYNYNLPDRGLGSMMSQSPIPAVTMSPPTVSVPRFPVTVPPSAASQILSYVAPAWQVTRPLSHSPLSNDSRNSGSPLDLSSVRDTSPTLTKVKPEGKISGQVEKPVPVNILPKQAILENGQIMAAMSPKQTTDTSGKKKQGTKSKNAANSPPGSAKPPYVQEMLYVCNKELEIVSVGKNKWIVRNENDLIDLIRSNAASSEGQLDSCKSSVTVSNGTENGNSLNGADVSKRPNSQSENGEHKPKVVKLTNGDVHTKENMDSAMSGQIHTAN